MAAIRVLLSNMSPILRDMFEHAVRQEPGVTLVRERPFRLVGGREAPAPDVVVVGCDTGDARQASMPVLEQWPHARVMVVTQAEGEAALCELRLHAVGLGRVSPAEVVRAVRSVIRHRRALPGPTASDARRPTGDHGPRRPTRAKTRSGR